MDTQTRSSSSLKRIRDMNLPAEDPPDISFKRKKNLNLEFFQIVLSDLCDAAKLEDLLDRGAEINFEDPDQDDLTPLAFAVSNEKFKVVPLLLKYGANIQLCDSQLKKNNGLVATDYAWKHQNYEIVSLLLRNDAAFPKGYSRELLGLPFKLRLPLFRVITEERFKFHKNIKNGEMEKVKKFVEENPKLKCAYDIDNHCALSTALHFKRFEIYCFLHVQTFCFGVDINRKKLKISLSIDDKSKLENFLGRYFKSPENTHIIKLFSKSKILFNNDSMNFKKIVGFFEQLNEIDEIRPVLKIVAGSVKSIDFDFKMGSVRNLDWTGYYLRDVKGRTYYDKGRILIGALRENEKDVLGTLAHELTHLALNEVYKNRCLPFSAQNNSTKEKFENIVKAYDNDRILSKSGVIEAAYSSENLHIRCIELIVRVNHLIALHYSEPERLVEIRENFKELFEFYSSSVLPDFEKASLGFDAKEEARHINDIFGLLLEINSYPLAIGNSKNGLQIGLKNENVGIQCEVPELVFKDMLTQNEECGSPEEFRLFVKQEQLRDDQNRHRILELRHTELLKTVFILYTEMALSDHDTNILNQFSETDRVVLVSKFPIESKFRKVFVEYFWQDLTSESKATFLQGKFLFQDHEIALNDIFSKDSAIFNYLSLKEILEIPNTPVKFIQLCEKVYIERSFQMSQKQSALTSKNIIDLYESSHTLILSDIAGSGKSMSAKHLTKKFKQNYPFYWVELVDLKLFTKFYCENDQKIRSIIVEDFFIDKILKLDGIEKKLFQHCFQNHKIFFTFDGFDEICPTYRNFVLNLISAVQGSKNKLLVTTRIFDARQLERELSSVTVHLKPFNEEDQIQLLMQHWKKSEEMSYDEIALKEKAVKLLDQKSIPKDFLQNPLQLYMFAEINDKIDQKHINKTKFNTYSLYYRFVEKKVEIWLSKGASIVKEVNYLIMKSISTMHVHQKLALDSLFKADEIETFRLPQMRDELSIAVINRVGLIRSIDNNMQFIHQTLIEYFVANFIVNNVTRKTALTSRTKLIMLFMKILRTVDYQKIRKFINDGLETVKENSEECDIDCLSEKFVEIFKDISNQDILERPVIEKLTHLIVFFLEDVRMPTETRLALLQCKNKEQNPILHVATAYIESFEALWKCVENFTSENERKIILKTKDAIGRFVFSSAVLNDQVLKFVLRNILIHLDSQYWLELLLNKDDESNTALHVIAMNRHSFILDDLWREVKNKLTKNEQKAWFRELGAFNETIFQSLVRDDNIKILPAALRVAIEIFDADEICAFLLAEDFTGSTVVHTAACFSRVEVLKSLWEFIKERLCLKRQKDLLLKTLKHGHNIFIRACRNHNKEMIKLVLDIAIKILDYENLFKVLKSKNFYGQSFLTLTSNNSAEIFPPKLLEKILHEPKEDSPEENVATLSKLTSQIKEINDATTLKRLLLERTGDKCKIQLAAQFGSVKLLEGLCSAFSKHLNEIEITDLFIPDLMHHSLHNSNNNHESSKLLWSFVTRCLSQETVLKVICGKDQRKRDMIELGIQINCPTVFEFCEFYKQCNAKQFKIHFCKRNRNENILLHDVARFCNAEMAESFFNLILNPPFEENDRKEMFLTKNIFKRIPLHRALNGRNEKTFELFYNNYRNILHLEGLKRILFHNDLDYFSHGNHKTEKLVHLLRRLATKDFGEESVNDKIQS